MPGSLFPAAVPPEVSADDSVEADCSVQAVASLAAEDIVGAVAGTQDAQADSSSDEEDSLDEDKWERETQPSRPDSRDSRTSRDSLRDERAMPPADQRQEMPMQQMEPHRITAERVKDKPQVPDWSDTPYSAPGESKRRDWHTHHPPPVTQQQLDSAGPSKKNFVPLRRGGVAKDDGKDDVKEGKVEENSRAEEDKAKEAAKKDDAEKRMPASRSRGGSGGRFEANRGRGGRGGNGYSSGNVGYRGRSREYRRSRTERGPRFDRKKDDGSEESSGVEEEKPTNRLRPKDEESEGSEEACPDSDRKNRTAKETGRVREPRRDEAKNKEEKSAFSPRGEPSRRGRGGAMSLGRSSRGRYQAGGYGPPTLKAPFGKPEDGNKEEEVSKEGSASQGSKPRSNSSRPVVRRPNRMEPLPPRFQKNQPRRPDNPERNKGRGGRGAGPSKDALSDVANEDWETASESSDVADRRGFDEGVRQQSSGSKKGPPTSSKAPGGGQERRRSGGEVRRGGGGAPGDRNGRGPVQRRDSGGGGPPARMGRGSGSRPGGRSRQQQQQRPGDVSAKGEPSQATLVYRMDEMKLQDPVGVQAALTDIGARKHIKKSEQGQPNGKLEKEKPNALEGIDLSNYASVVVIDDHPAVTDPSLCDGDDGDFQEVTSKKRHKVLADGDSKKKKEAHDDEVPSADVAFDDLRAGGVLIPAEITLEDFADADKDFELCAELTDDEIIHQVTEDSDDSDTETEEPAPTQPTSSELTRALMTLSLVYSGNMTLTEIEADIIAGKRTVQKKISDFFAPKC
ncbi:hypothetical protein HPB52_003335 [Rhipicephalus sanguineus]|uniref:Uncharacterized protein n=1 Tax=Rhipicephalus sanguineus TaxID=34632 RepID=A0A9D4QHJ1_RHISA|nr:hypothetical protein HPB52_003335 [Rhipicephalus sanguineus]